MSPSIAAAPRGPGIQLRNFYHLIAKYPPLLFIVSAVALVNILFEPNRFADYYQYLVITDGLYFFASGQWFDFELLSNLLFLSLRIATGNTVQAVNLAHYMLGGAYIYFAFLLAHRHEVNWRGLLITFGLYGALLAFVTIRATPAYLFVALAALDVTKGRMRAVALVILGSLFHVSALLALGPILLGLMQNRLRALAWIEHSTRAVVIMILALIAAFGLLQTMFANVLDSLIQIVPFLNKYEVYTASLDPLNNPTQGGGLSTNHLLYAFVMSVFTLLFVLMPDARCRKMRLYVMSSYVLFLILEFAPVTAYRQSQFWAIPAMLVFPWQRFAPSGFRAIVLTAACVAIFLFSLGGVVA